MTILQFRHNFLENEYFLSPHKNALFSAINVAFCIAAAYFFELGICSGGLIIGAQSITGINRQGAFRIRLGLAGKGAVVLSFIALLGFLAGQNFILSLGLAVVVAFCFGWCRQIFPLNWPDIIIPAGVLFYMNYSTPMVDYTILGTIVGLAFELLLGLFIYVKRYLSNKIMVAPSAEKLPPSPDKPDKKILGLKEYLFIYSIELSMILIAGFFIMRNSSYPHIYWIPLTAIIVLKVGQRTTLKRVVERTLGTLAGCLLGSILLYLHPDFFIKSLLMVLCIYFWVRIFQKKYAIGTIFITTFVLLLLNEEWTDIYMIAFERGIFTILGGAVAMAISLVFLRKERL